jgi:hypothetical protein
MTWWLIMYLVGYGIFTALWVVDDLREHKPAWSILAELASDICMVVAALGFWLTPLRNILGNLALPIFVAGLAWFFVAGSKEFREHFPDEKLPVHHNIAAVLFGMLFLALISGPLLYWGFMYAVLGSYSST